MSLYKEFLSLLPYLQSIRKLENYLTFDVSFPSTWKLPKKYVEEDKVMEQAAKIPNERFFSFVSEISEESLEKMTLNLENIIKYNLDREEKEKLFLNKVEELKIIFEKQDLNSLKNLNFELKYNKPKSIVLKDEEESIERVGVTE